MNQYLIIDEGKLYLIDAGFIGSYTPLVKALHQHGLADSPIEGIIITHGHIDHTFHAQKIADEYGAWIAAPLLDKELIAGNYSAQHLNKDQNKGLHAGIIGNGMQHLAKHLFNYQAPHSPIDWFEHGRVFPILGGLKVINTPGHTAGHTVLYSQTQHILFSADVFASHSRFPHMPPPIFNQNTELAKKCINQVLAIDPNLKGIYPNHGDLSSPSQHLARLKQYSEAQKFRD